MRNCIAPSDPPPPLLQGAKLANPVLVRERNLVAKAKFFGHVFSSQNFSYSHTPVFARYLNFPHWPPLAIQDLESSNFTDISEENSKEKI